MEGKAVEKLSFPFFIEFIMHFMLILNDNLKYQLANAIMAILLIIICFPAYEPQFDKGIDESLVWAYNYLFAENFYQTSSLLFPHGPLAFLMYPLPLGNNLVFAFLFDSLLKLIMFYSMQSFQGSKQANFSLGTFAACLFLFHILNVQMLVISALISLLCVYFYSRKKLYAVLALGISALAIYIKSYVGIICGLIAFSFIISDYIRQRNLKDTLLFAIIFVLSYPFFWLLMYGNFSNFFTFLYGVKELASDNSAAAAFYPDNNWIYLSLAIFTFMLIPILDKSKFVLFFYSITALAVFAAWKHGMARQDIYHTRGLFFFLLVFFSLLNFYNEEKRKRTLIFSLFTLIFFALNLPNVRLYEENQLSFFRVNRFAEFVFSHKNFKNCHLESSFKKIEEQKLDSSLLKMIGNKTVDVYPWDYSYIAANKLNWQPRPVLHSYAAYSSWLDAKDSEHFRSSTAPEFIMLEIDKKTDDIYAGSFESIDNRYLPNDEPKTMLSFLENYKTVHKSNRFILLRKRESPLKSKLISLGKFKARFNETIILPKNNANDMIRLKASINKSFKGVFQSFLFKDQESFITYFMENGDSYRYKIVPKNAADGILINPMLMHPETDFMEARVTKISFESSDPSFYASEIELEWELIELNMAATLFGKKIQVPKRVLHSTSGSSIKTSIEANGFSKSFNMPIDSIAKLCGDSAFEIKSNFWTGNSKDALLVYSIEDSTGKNLFWEGMGLQKFLLLKNALNPVTFVKKFENLESYKGKNAILSVYIWNRSTTFEISNFNISILKN
jgi:hypothetical protein